MSKQSASLLACTGLILALIGEAGAAGDYPRKAIDFVIPFAAGAENIAGRVLAREMSKVLGVPVVPVNKPGAGGAVAYTYVKNANTDGYTIVWSSPSLLTTTNVGRVPYLYDALDHIGRVEYQPLVLAVRQDARWETFEEFIGLCRKRPGKLKLGNSGVGSTTHLAAIAMMKAARCRVTHLPLGSTRSNSKLLSGEADAVMAPLSSVLKLVKANKLRMLVHSSAEDHADLPGVPSLQALGHDVEFDLFHGISVPKGTPEEIRAALEDAMWEAARSQQFRVFARQKGFTVAPLLASEFETYLEVNNKLVKSLMRKAGLYQSRLRK